MDCVAEFVVADLADEAGSSAQGRRHNGRVGRGTARHDGEVRGTGPDHGFGQLNGTVGLDELHRPLEQAVFDEELIGGGMDHVDDRMADRDDLRSAHEATKLRENAGRGERPVPATPDCIPIPL